MTTQESQYEILISMKEIVLRSIIYMKLPTYLKGLRYILLKDIILPFYVDIIDTFFLI